MSQSIHGDRMVSFSRDGRLVACFAQENSGHRFLNFVETIDTETGELVGKLEIELTSIKQITFDENDNIWIAWANGITACLDSNQMREKARYRLCWSGLGKNDALQITQVNPRTTPMLPLSKR